MSEGFFRSFASSQPPRWVRLLLVVEVIGYVAAVAGYAFFTLPLRRVGPFDVAFFIFAGAFPIAMNLLHGDRPADSGIRLDNLARSAREVIPATAAMATGIVIVGLIVGGFHWTNWRHFRSQLVVYVLWGPTQQYLLQAFGLRRLKQASLPAAAAVVAAAVLFALVHAPNWPLVALAAGGGIVWCVLFSRQANLLTLGLAHATLAILVYYAWPESWLHRMTIGGEYLLRASMR